MNPNVTNDSARRPKRRALWTVVTVVIIAIFGGLLYLSNQIPSKTPAQENEGNAIDSLHAISGAEDQYRSNFPDVGFACSLSALGGDPNVGPPTPQAAEVLPGGLPTGRESGYVFSIRCSQKPNFQAPDSQSGSTGSNSTSAAITAFEVTAVPQTIGESGQRGFCMDQTGEIRVDPRGGTNCTGPLE